MQIEFKKMFIDVEKVGKTGVSLRIKLEYTGGFSKEERIELLKGDTLEIDKILFVNKK